MTAELQWDDVENTIFAMVKNGTELTDRHVIWDYQKAPRPAPPFVEMSLSEIDMPGGDDWVVYDDAPDPQPGAELRVRTRGWRSVELTLQAYGDPTGVGPCWRLLSRLLASLALYYPTLDDAGVGVGDISAVSSISGKKGGVLEPRARLKMTLYVASELEGRDTFIERVDLDVTAGPLTQSLEISAT